MFNCHVHDVDFLSFYLCISCWIVAIICCKFIYICAQCMCRHCMQQSPNKIRKKFTSEGYYKIWRHFGEKKPSLSKVPEIFRIFTKNAGNFEVALAIFLPAYVGKLAGGAGKLTENCPILPTRAGVTLNFELLFCLEHVMLWCQVFHMISSFIVLFVTLTLGR